MEVLSVYRYARISAYKARQVAREVQGLPVSQALDIVNFTPKKAAFLIGKTLKSAVANAENNHELMADTLIVKECTIGEGPSFRRFKARARGSAAPIRRSTSHIRVILSEAPDEDGGKKKESKPKAKKKAAPKKAAVPKKEEAPAKSEAADEAAPAADANSADLGVVYATAPTDVDDLKKISGVGPALEDKLNGFGIYTYEQIKKWEAPQIAAFDDLLSFKGRIERDEWIRQATELDADKA